MFSIGREYRGDRPNEEAVEEKLIHNQHVIMASLEALHQKVDAIMTQQDDLNALVATLVSSTADLGAEFQALKDQIDANPGLPAASLDLSGLTTAVQGVTDLDVANALPVVSPPADVPAPADVADAAAPGDGSAPSA